MLSKLKEWLVGPPMPIEEKMFAVQFLEALWGKKIFKLGDKDAEQYIREFGFPMRPDDGKYAN